MPGRIAMEICGGCFAVVPGVTTPGTCARPVVNGTRLLAETTTRASVLPGPFSRVFIFLCMKSRTEEVKICQPAVRRIGVKPTRAVIVTVDGARCHDATAQSSPTVHQPASCMDCHQTSVAIIVIAACAFYKAATAFFSAQYIAITLVAEANQRH